LATLLGDPAVWVADIVVVAEGVAVEETIVLDAFAGLAACLSQALARLVPVAVMAVMALANHR
jgi:hypothetical protein